MPISARAKKTLAKAEGGNADAMEEIGSLYWRGDEGLELDLAEAHRWWRKAADKGNTDAMQNLAVAYRNGEGEIRADLVEAAKWFARGSNGEHDEAWYLAWMKQQAKPAKAAAPPKAQKKIAAATKNAIRLEPSPKPETKLPVGTSKIGGEPDLPSGTAWPEGMTFLAQVDLAEVAAHDVDRLLPKKGRLFFFHDTRKHDTGRVVFASPTAKLARARSPLVAKGKYDIVALEPASIAFTKEKTTPSPVSSEVAKWKLEGAEHAAYADGRPTGGHRMLGHADLIQEDTPKGVLLLQLTADERIRSNWDGTVYFVIAEKDLAAKRFEKTKVVFQS